MSLPVEKASDLAEKDYIEDRLYFYAVANGYGPSRPGFKLKLTKCSMLDTEWKMLWVGADHDFCEGRVDLEKRALDFANKFNTKMSELIKGDAKSYSCPDAL